MGEDQLDSIVENELELLKVVSTLLDESPYDIPPSEEQIVQDLLTLREEIPGAKDEDRGALMDQYNARIYLLEQLREARKRPQVNPDSPYFAHIRLQEGGKSRDLCLGKATRIERGIRIIDWRNAPISRIFYQYQQGDEYIEDIGSGTLEGIVEARRTVTIKKQQLTRVDAPEGIFTKNETGEWVKADRDLPRLAGGEGVSVRYHASGDHSKRRLGTDLAGHRRRMDKRLPDIAGLIDPDQFNLITKPSSGFVVIRGTAGSGKTTVALHRIAWLAFNDQSMDSSRTLFIVFSSALRDYVSHVLPGLHINRVEISTFSDWINRQRVRHFPRLPRKLCDSTPGVVVRLKSHPLMLRALELHIRRTEGRPNGEQAFDDWASTLTQPELLQEAMEEVAPGSFTASQIKRVCRWCHDRNEAMVARLDGDKEAEAAIDEEDSSLLLRAWQLRVGPLRGKGRRPLQYKHISIDEVQDFSPLDVRVLLGCLDKNECITLAGDTQQHVMLESGFQSWADFFRHLGVDGTEVNTLRISYRCSFEVVQFAMSLLGDLREDDTPPMVTRSGPEVELFQFTEHGACVAFRADTLKALLMDEPFASVIVLTPGKDISHLYYDGLDRGEVPRLHRVTNQNFTFQPGVEVTEVEQVKGLEFDYVILVETSAARYPDTPLARRLLHVGATRAVHQLWLTSVETTSPIVRQALQTTPSTTS